MGGFRLPGMQESRPATSPRRRHATFGGLPTDSRPGARVCVPGGVTEEDVLESGIQFDQRRAPAAGCKLQRKGCVQGDAVAVITTRCTPRVPRQDPWLAHITRAQAASSTGASKERCPPPTAPRTQLNTRSPACFEPRVAAVRPPRRPWSTGGAAPSFHVGRCEGSIQSIRS